MQRKRDAIKAALENKGFRPEECKHHDRYLYYVDDKFTGVHTRLSRGSGYREYTQSLLSQMKKQLKLDTNQQLLSLIDCPMSEEDYRQIIQEKGFI